MACDRLTWCPRARPWCLGLMVGLIVAPAGAALGHDGPFVGGSPLDPDPEGVTQLGSLTLESLAQPVQGAEAEGAAEGAAAKELEAGGEAIAQTPNLDLDPEIIDNSPVLQRWLQGTPDIAEEIRHQPSFRTRLRLGYTRFPSTGGVGGFALGVEDLFVVPGTGLAVGAGYSQGGGGLREDYGGEARYYLLPLGGYVNLAPTVGYRSLTTPDYSTDGLSLGLRLMLVPSRGGAADVAISQQWVALGGDTEVGLTSVSLGYAVTRQLRLGTDLQFQNSRFGQDSRLGLSLEWLL